MSFCLTPPHPMAGGWQAGGRQAAACAAWRARAGGGQVHGRWQAGACKWQASGRKMRVGGGQANGAGGWQGGFEGGGHARHAQWWAGWFWGWRRSKCTECNPWRTILPGCCPQLAASHLLDMPLPREVGSGSTAALGLPVPPHTAKESVGATGRSCARYRNLQHVRSSS